MKVEVKELPRELIYCRKRLVIYMNLVVPFFLFKKLSAW